MLLLVYSPFLKKATHKMPEAVASRTKKLLFNIAGTGAIKALNIGIGFLLVRFSIQFLGEENYGVWLAMLSFFTWFSAFEVGVSSSVRNFITKAFAESNFEQIKALIEKALKALSMIYVISIAAILVASFMFPIQHFFVGDGFEIPNFSFIFRFSTVFYLSHFVFFLLNTVYFAIHRTTASFLILAIQNALLLLGVVAMIQLVDTNQFLYYAIWFSVVPAATWSIASIVSYLTSLKQAKPSFTKTVFKKSEPFKIVNWAFFLIQICMLVIYSTDNLIIINLLGGTDVALYNIAFKYFNIIQVGFNLIIVPYWSSFTDAAHQKDVPWIKKNVSILLQIWLAFAVLAILMYLVAPTAYRLWMGKEMEIPTLLSMIMALSALLTAWIAIFSYFLNAVAELKAQRNIILVSAFINIPLSIWLLGLFGISGVIMATCVSLLPLAIVLPQQYLRVVQKMNIES
jgi:O-antigen/teichoic acid export membrane protein